MTPYEYHNTKLGVKLNFLISDRNKSEQSLCLVSYQTLRWRLDSKSSKETRLRNSCLNTEALVEYATICQAWKDALILKFGAPQEQIKKSFFASHYITDKIAYDFYLNFVYGKSKRLTIDLVNEYTFNASILNTVRLVKNNRKALRKAQGNSSIDIWQTLANEVANFKEVAHTIPVKSLRNKFNDYNNGGYEALVSGKLQNDNAKKMNQRIMKLVNSLFASQKHKPTATDVARQYDSFLNGYAEVYNTETGELYNAKEFTKLSKATIINYLSAWENKLVTHALRSNDRQKLIGNFTTSHKMDMPKYAGSITSIDDRQPPFVYDTQGNRVWFYIGQDLASLFIHTWVYGKDKKGIIIEFYRQMVRNHYAWGFNMPHELECESNLNSSFTNTFLQDGAMFQNVRIESNNARGKRIERTNRTLRYEHEKELEGWIARPFAKSESNQSDGKKTIIPYDTIVYNTILGMQDYNNMAHVEQANLSRYEYFCAYQNKDLKPTNWRMILKYLGYVTKTSCKVGEIALQGGKYLLGDNGSICTGDSLIAKMIEVEGKTIEIYWLDNAEGKVIQAHIYIGENYIGEAISKPSYNRASVERTVEDFESQILMSRYVMTCEGFRKKQTLEIEPIAIINQKPKTLNNNFVAPELKRFEVQEPKTADELEIPIENEDEFLFVPSQNNNATSWQNSLT